MLVFLQTFIQVWLRLLISLSEPHLYEFSGGVVFLLFVGWGFFLLTDYGCNNAISLFIQASDVKLITKLRYRQTVTACIILTVFILIYKLISQTVIFKEKITKNMVFRHQLPHEYECKKSSKFSNLLTQSSNTRYVLCSLFLFFFLHMLYTTTAVR